MPKYRVFGNFPTPINVKCVFIATHRGGGAPNENMNSYFIHGHRQECAFGKILFYLPMYFISTVKQSLSSQSETCGLPKNFFISGTHQVELNQPLGVSIPPFFICRLSIWMIVHLCLYYCQHPYLKEMCETSKG